MRRLVATSLHDVGNFAVKARQPRAASRNRRKCLQLVLRLDVGQLPAKCSGGLSDKELFTYTDGEDGGVRFPDAFQCLVEIHLG